jgi:hypothetical protein
MSDLAACREEVGKSSARCIRLISGNWDAIEPRREGEGVAEDLTSRRLSANYPTTL